MTQAYNARNNMSTKGLQLTGNTRVFIRRDILLMSTSMLCMGMRRLKSTVKLYEPLIRTQIVLGVLRAID